MAKLAIAHVNKNNSLLGNYDLALSFLNGECKADMVMKRFIEIITNKDYMSIIGILGKSINFYYLQTKIILDAFLSLI